MIMLFTQVWNSYTFQFWKEKCNRLQAVKTLICLSLINVIIRYLFVCNYWYLSPVSISGQDRHDLTSFVCKKIQNPDDPGSILSLIMLVILRAIITPHCQFKLEITLSRRLYTTTAITDLSVALLSLNF